jgi:SAM-dependent methyltransferase
LSLPAAQGELGQMEFSRTRLSLRRRPLSYDKVRKVLGPFARRWPGRGAGAAGAYINVGCGRNVNPDFFNIDLRFYEGVDMAHDLSKPLPIATGVVRGVFSEHCLEHLDTDVARFVLGELHRVMAPGAVLRLSVPDGETYIRNYMTGAAMPYAEEDGLDGGYTAMMSVNRIFYGSGHRFIYDFDTLALLLTRSGFSDVTRAAFRKGRDPALLVDQEMRREESVYVEAVR